MTHGSCHDTRFQGLILRYVLDENRSSGRSPSLTGHSVAKTTLWIHDVTLFLVS